MRIDAARLSSLLTTAFVAAALVLGAWLGLKQMMGVASVLDRVENLTLDWRFLLAGARPAPDGVVIVAIDDQTVSEAEGHTLSRKTLARIVRAIADFHPRVVALDIAFPDSKGENEDAELAEALKSTPSVVASIGVFGGGERSGGEPQSTEMALAPKPSEVLWPTDAIRDATLTGLANVSTDSSGIPRYVPMIFEVPEGVVPSFALAVLSAAVGADPVFGPDRMELGGRTTKMDLGYHLPIRYYGPAGSFRRYSAAKLLRGALDAEALRDQIAVVGMTAAGLGDTFATPFDRVAPGVEIFATAINNLLRGDTLARTPSTRRVDAAMAAGLPVAMIALMAMRRAAVGLALAALVFVLWAAGTFLAFVNGYWLSMALPLATSIPLLACYTGARFLIERHLGRKAAAERAMLAQFQSPLLVDHMLREPQFLDKPVRQDVAVIFLDLSGSTGVAEALGPERSRDLLLAMQTLVEREVTAQRGVVINYMGDGVLALFGLPKPESDDAARALTTVESLYASVAAWVADLPPAARDRLDFRIGAHFGPAILSRLGSPTHQHITAAGDTVNVASRLLEVAKQQHCRIVVSEDLFAAATAAPGSSSKVDAANYAALTVPIRGRSSSLKIRMRN
ncbi:MAG: adenylate/guanylate cyclase domain-containing protein [Hyphomicrobiales bacterium]|nr:adenylate/guanylate cyclase domain-containing protein [Hyphomicrobiales bacterium]